MLEKIQCFRYANSQRLQNQLMWNSEYVQAFQVLCEMITSRITVETCSLSNNKREIIGEIKLKSWQNYSLIIIIVHFTKTATKQRNVMHETRVMLRTMFLKLHIYTVTKNLKGWSKAKNNGDLWGGSLCTTQYNI